MIHDKKRWNYEKPSFCTMNECLMQSIMLQPTSKFADKLKSGAWGMSNWWKYVCKIACFTIPRKCVWKKHTINSSPSLSPFQFLYYSFFKNERRVIENSFKVKITVFSPQGYDDIIATVIKWQVDEKSEKFSMIITVISSFGGNEIDIIFKKKLSNNRKWWHQFGSPWQFCEWR